MVQGDASEVAHVDCGRGGDCGSFGAEARRAKVDRDEARVKCEVGLLRGEIALRAYQDGNIAAIVCGQRVLYRDARMRIVLEAVRYQA